MIETDTYTTVQEMVDSPMIKKSMKVDMSSHIGLRGFAAIWVMVFHTLFFSKHSVDLQGSSLMPLFFLLSGFSLAVAYGDRCGEMYFENKLLFYQNRIARVYPLYYICTLFALPLWFYGYGSSDPGNVFYVTSSIIVSILPLCTLLCFFMGSSIDGPGWTICTLMIMWLIFPYSFPSIKAMTDQQLYSAMSRYFWIQLFILSISFIAFIILFGFWPAFAVATMNPITRYPIFLMGVCAGELSRRRAGKSLVWPSFAYLLPSCLSNVPERTPGDDEAYWSGRATTVSLVSLLLTLCVTAGDTVQRYTMNGGGILGALWFQGIMPFLQLEVIIALTRASPTALVNRFLNHPILQYLGEISMAIYLVHIPVMQYLCWIIEGGRLKWPTELDCSVYDDDTSEQNCEDEVHDFTRKILIPLWGMPVVWGVSLVLAVILYHGIEEPSRKLLRSSTRG